MINKKAYHHWEAKASILAKLLPWNSVSKRAVPAQCGYWGRFQ